MFLRAEALSRRRYFEEGERVMTQDGSTEIWISARVDEMDKFSEAALSGMFVNL